MSIREGFASNLCQFDQSLPNKMYFKSKSVKVLKTKEPKLGAPKFLKNWRHAMNKSELIEYISNEADISKAAATRALASIQDAVLKCLKKGDTLTLVGFGSFSVTKRAARTGRNPRTGAALKIKAAKVPKFKPGKALKEAVNK